MTRMLVTACAAMLFAAQASAAEIVIPMPEATEVQTSDAIYDCGDREVAVTYVNAGSVSLAVMQIDGETVVASNVISGSGARYAGAQYIWWSKGDAADLYNLTQGEGDPVANCSLRG